MLQYIVFSNWTKKYNSIQVSVLSIKRLVCGVKLLRNGMKWGKMENVKMGGI